METLVGSEVYREAMRLFTGAVNIVTTGGEHGSGGFTATAVCSVSDEPPTLLVCINQTNELREKIVANGLFAVNLLAEGSEALSNRFAGYDKVPMAERLEVGDWEIKSNGLPVLRNHLACFQCRVKEMVQSGTHYVLFGEVQSVTTSSSKSPLLYFDRGYALLK